ncbi:MAG: hypothetical protein GWN93_05965 [Deltaproteobacteria bacterium]|nr:hypothetical protein [Deltaproteobacteria bacterium]
MTIDLYSIWDKDVKRDVDMGVLEIPTADLLKEWVYDTLSEAACACEAMIEHDGRCQHGRPSWLAALGIV